jgi:hypothetical protein
MDCLADWPRLRAVLRRLGVPHRGRFRGAVLRQLAREALVEVGVRPRAGGPLLCFTLAEHRTIFALRRLELRRLAREEEGQR